jgi:hypothetical protein
MDISHHIQYVHVSIFWSSAPLFLERTTFNHNPGLLSQLFTEVLITVATANHLLAPLHALYDANSFILENFKTSASRQVYYEDHADHLNKIGEELLFRFARTPIIVLIVNTPEPRWADTLNAPGFEYTIVVEEQLANVILANTPEARLFGFAVFYHEIGHLFHKWVGFKFTLVLSLS